MTENQPSSASRPLINRALVNFQPAEYERIKESVLRSIDVVARAFCESKWSMLCAIRNGEARIGTVNDYEGSFCVYIEYQGTQLIKPVRSIH